MAGKEGCALALDIGGTKVAAAIVTSEGQLRRHRSAPLALEGSARETLAAALGMARAVLEDEPLEARAIGVSTKGLTSEDGVSISGARAGWDDLPIPRTVREWFPALPAVVLNDVRAATLGEMKWGELRGVANGLYVNLGTGLAAGLVVDGKVVEGAHGAAGEIGYLVPSREILAGFRRGDAPLEELYAGQAVPVRTLDRLGRALTMEGLSQLAESDSTARRLKEELLDELALWIANLAVVLDPSKVVIGGGFLKADARLCLRIGQSLARIVPFAPEIAPARFGANASLAGAGAAALRLLPHASVEAGAAVERNL